MAQRSVSHFYVFCYLAYRFPSRSVINFCSYGRITERILSHNMGPIATDSIQLLAWLVCATRPLYWREVQCARSIRPEKDAVDFSHQYVIDAKELCGALIDEKADGTLALVHTTAKQ